MFLPVCESTEWTLYIKILRGRTVDRNHRYGPHIFPGKQPVQPS